MNDIPPQWHVPDDGSGEASQLCMEFESALNSGQRPEIEQYLEETPRPNRSTLLTQLVMVDLRHRFQAGEPPSLEEYFERFTDERHTLLKLQAYWEQLQDEMQRALERTAIARTERTLGRFQLRLKVGSGGFGEVWQAWDPQLKRNVAVKTLDPEKAIASDLMARHEASIAAQLNHPNLVALYEYVESDEETYLVSEFIEGTDLRAQIKMGPINFSKAVDICRHVARGLHQAHLQGIIHRDIKPANILVSLRGQPKLADFGVAHWQGADGTLRNDRELIGTAVYMSPEQASGRSVVPESDIYSLGVVLYEMLTGKPPFTGSATNIVMGHQMREPIPPRRIDRRIPRDLEIICLKMLAKKPRDRYRTAEALAEDLDRFSFKLPPIACRLNLFQRAWRRVMRKPRQTAATAGGILTFALCLSGLAIYGFQPPVDDDRLAVKIVTEPPGATVSVHRRDDVTFRPSHRTAFSSLATPCEARLIPGKYLVVSHDPRTGRFLETNRNVPVYTSDKVLSWTTNLWWRTIGQRKIEWIGLVLDPPNLKQDLVLVPGGAVTMVDPANPSRGEQEITVPPFYISTREFTVDEFLALNPSQTIPVETTDRYLGYRGADPHRPLNRECAYQWAEGSGCRLPTEAEYLYLSQQIDIPEGWERTATDNYENADWDVFPAQRPVRGIVTGLAEWCIDYPLSRDPDLESPKLLKDPEHWGIVWGGNAHAETLHGTSESNKDLRTIYHRFLKHRAVGFRLARSFHAREADK